MTLYDRSKFVLQPMALLVSNASTGAQELATAASRVIYSFDVQLRDFDLDGRAEVVPLPEDAEPIVACMLVEGFSRQNLLHGPQAASRWLLESAIDQAVA